MSNNKQNAPIPVSCLLITPEELEALQRNRERLDWIADNPGFFDTMTGFQTFREAIDAARGEGGTVE